MLVITLIILFFFIIGSIVFFSWKYGISPMPSSPRATKAIVAMIPRPIQGPVVDLGSGWGTLALALAREFPDKAIFAYEISPMPWLASKIICRICGVKNLNFIRHDFFEIPFGEVQGVVCYLYPGAMSKLKAKFEKELKPGAWVISNTFAVPGWTPDSIHYLDDWYKTPIYLYHIR